MNKQLMTNWRWWIVVLLFFATTVNYMDRQVLSLTWKDFIAPEFHWNDNDYGTITALPCEGKDLSVHIVDSCCEE